MSEKILTTLVDYSNRRFIEKIAKNEQKRIGQFFTPAPIAIFMAKQFLLKYNEISILDPGAGTGILTAAICDRILESNERKVLKAHLYENDIKVLSLLKENLQTIKAKLESDGHIFEYEIFPEDFVIENSKFINGDSLFSDNSNKPQYDIIISNPPYYKLKKEDILSKQMAEIVHGQPNIYSFFMAISACLLRVDGEMVFITPRSFCSGSYFKKFRKWFLLKVRPVFIHSFASRKELFGSVLQETIILKAIKTKYEPENITISVSQNSNFDCTSKITGNYYSLINQSDVDNIINIPTCKQDLEILNIIRSWKHIFTDLGFRISTGPIVSFRATEFLTNEFGYDGNILVPIFWMNHLKDFSIKYPIHRLEKPQTIKVTGDSYKILLKNKNYVFVKRFSSKEQKKRIYASFYSRNFFNTNYIGIENHLNYIWKPHDELTTIESLGIMAILNSTVVDKYFRIINGNTQVNASEINNLPFPSYNDVISIGKTIKGRSDYSLNLFDSVVTEQLKIPHKVWGRAN